MALWGQARKEVLSNKPLILQRLSEGSSIRSIWMELSREGRVSVALQNFHGQVRKLTTLEAGKPAPGVRQLTRASITDAPTLFSAPTIGQSKNAPASKPGHELARVENGAAAETGCALPPDIDACFGNAPFVHDPLAKPVRGERPESDGETTNQPKEQKNAG
jgi:hypothetical protein